MVSQCIRLVVGGRFAVGYKVVLHDRVRRFLGDSSVPVPARNAIRSCIRDMHDDPYGAGHLLAGHRSRLRSAHVRAQGTTYCVLYAVTGPVVQVCLAGTHETINRYYKALRRTLPTMLLWLDHTISRGTGWLDLPPATAIHDQTPAAWPRSSTVEPVPLPKRVHSPRLPPDPTPP